MGKPSKAKKAENVGTGKITPAQVAFIVDRYLSDNNYTKTLSAFRLEASNLVSATKVREAPRSLLSLGAILDEYICLKEQKVILDQEKCRVERLLQGMQHVMQAYNHAGNIAPIPAMAPTPQIVTGNGSNRGYSVYNTPKANPIPMLPCTATNVSTPVTNLPSTSKRKTSRLVSDATPTAKKSCTTLPTKALGSGGTEIPRQATDTNADQDTVQQLSISHSNSRPPRVSSVQGSSVAKSLFKQTHPQTDSSWPKTPPQELPYQADKSVSPLEASSVNSSTPQKKSNTPQRITSADCHIITSERIVVSPFKYTGCYTMDSRSLRVSSSSPLKSTPKRSGRRDHIKGRLDFDDSNVLMCTGNTVSEEISTTTNIDEMAEIFDLDIPNFDVFGSDFSLSELLVDFDMETEGMGLPSHQTMDPSDDLTAGPEQNSKNQGSPTSEDSSEPPMLSITTILSEKDMSKQGPDSLISVKSTTKCIKIVSPAKRQRSCSEDEKIV